METLSTTLGARPDFDMLAKLYRPDTPHETLPEVEGEYRVFRIRIDGVTVRYVEEMHTIQVTVEGDLPGRTLDRLTSDVCDKLSALENSECEPRPL
jgi:hypothetical protein